MAAKGTMGKLANEMAGDLDTEGRDRRRIMPFGSGPWSHADGSFPGARGSGEVQHVRHVQRGKNGFALLPGNRTRRCIMFRDDEILSSRGLRNALSRVPA